MMNFDQSPFLVIWEVTGACDLVCVHCRACAVPIRHALELTTREGFALLDEIHCMDNPLMVFTGGDPLKRPDLFQLLAESVRLGLRTTVTPGATSLLTEVTFRRFHQLGVSRMAISLDGQDALSHDSFRRVAGSFDRSLLALEEARRIGLETQVNTTSRPPKHSTIVAMSPRKEKLKERLKGLRKGRESSSAKPALMMARVLSLFLTSVRFTPAAFSPSRRETCVANG